MSAKGHRVHVDYHQWMLEDEVRNERLEAMIQELVKPGSVVADLGTGSGILAILARKAGAARVYAIDASPIVRLAAQMAADNGIDGITWIEGDIASVELPEQVDAVFSECLGNFAFSDAMFGAVGCFARRWLKEGGGMGPCAVRLYGQPIDARLSWEPAKFWSKPWRGLDLSAFKPADFTHVRVIDAFPAFLREQPSLLASFDPYDRPEAFAMRESWTLSEDRVVTGVAAWFEVDWAPGVTMTTIPGSPETHWSQVLFPLPPREAKAGDTIAIAIDVFFDEKETPQYTWSGTWTDRDGNELESSKYNNYEHFGRPLDSSPPV